MLKHSLFVLLLMHFKKLPVLVVTLGPSILLLLLLVVVVVVVEVLLLLSLFM
jgi:hypothetical protein